VGAGIELQPSALQGFGAPVSVFLQYQHSWYGNAHLQMPAASPAFNYSYRRENDTFKVGVNVHLNAP